MTLSEKMVVRMLLDSGRKITVYQAIRVIMAIRKEAKK